MTVVLHRGDRPAGYESPRSSYPSVEQAMATAFANASIGDEVTQHEYRCDLTDDCGCRVIVYRLAVDGWQVIE
jgi:hypothetical protein